MPDLRSAPESFHRAIQCGLYASAVVFPFLLCISTAGMQNRTITRQPGIGEKLVEVEPQTRDDAVMITAVMVEGSMVPCGLILRPNEVQPISPFRASNDWLQTMTITFFNRTNRTIVAASLTLGFIDTGDGSIGQPMSGYVANLGRIPAIDAFSSRTGQPQRIGPNSKPLAWEPGKTFTVRIAEHMDGIKDQLQNVLLVTSVTKVAIHIGPFWFQDGMRCFGGVFEAPDRGHPGKYKTMADDYFPGNKLLNWPPGYSY